MVALGCRVRGVVLAATLVGLVWPSRSAVAQVVSATPDTVPANTVAAELVLGLPAALATGLSSGVGATYVRRSRWLGWGTRLAWGAVASWSTATEYSLTEEVRNDDIRMRVCGLLQHQAGRGSLGLRLGLGATTVYESRTREQGSRAGLSGSALQVTHWYLFPAGDLDAVVFLRVWNAWGMTLSGGPSLHLIDGSARVGWTSGLGVAWQP